MSRNRIVLLCMCVVSVLIMIIGIGAGAMAAPAVSQTPAQKVIKWRLQSMFASDYMYDINMKRFTERVKKASGGRLQIELYPAGAVVPTFEMLNAVRKGALQMAAGGPVYWTGMLPALAMCDVPMTLSDDIREYQYFWWELGMVELMRKEYAKYNAHLVTFITSIPYGSTMSTKPIRTLADFKGIKIRTFGLLADLWKSFGASVVSVPVGEMYTALATGTIDGAHWGGPYNFYLLKIHEVAKYYLEPPLLGQMTNDLFVNMDAWKSLPPDLQEIVTLTGRMISNEMAVFAHARNSEYANVFKKAGVAFSRLPDSDLKTLRSKAMEMLDKRARKDDTSAKAAEIIKKAMKIYR